MAFTYHDDMERLDFTSGSVEPTVGETITGATSGETCVLVSVTLLSGAYVDTDAAGYLYVENVSGAFQSENLNGSTSGANFATIAADATGGFDRLNWLRLFVGDTDSSYALFTDNELEGLLTLTSNNIIAAATFALKAMAVDPDRIMTLCDKLGGAYKMETLMDMCWKRAEALGG